MITEVKELELAVAALPEDAYKEFRNWFFEIDWEKWDHQIESDSGSGKLDFLIQEAHQEKKDHRLKEL